VIHLGQDTVGFHAKGWKLIRLMSESQSLTGLTKDTLLFMEYLGKLNPHLQKIILDDARFPNKLICAGLPVPRYSLVNAFEAMEEPQMFSSSTAFPVTKFGYAQYTSANSAPLPPTHPPLRALPSEN
jgi:hypothetical protein